MANESMQAFLDKAKKNLDFVMVGVLGVLLAGVAYIAWNEAQAQTPPLNQPQPATLEKVLPNDNTKAVDQLFQAAKPLVENEKYRPLIEGDERLFGAAASSAAPAGP